MNLDGKSPVLIDSQNRFGTILEMVMSDTVELWAVDALAAALCIQHECVASNLSKTLLLDG